MVGTNALRVAKNSPQFLREARAALGFPIEVISGREEARLIYLGVAHSLPKSAQRRLVIDIGGGSTEFIIGTGFEPQLTESLYMGCVSFSLKYFPEGKIDKSRMKAAELAARQELAALVEEYRHAGWDEAVGSSGTARSMENILRENEFAAEGLTREGLDKLRSLLLKHEKADPDRIAGLRPNRAPVLPGGVAIMIAAFDALGLESMKVSDGALRHGVLYDLLGRVQHRDMREATVAQFMRRYHVDAAQAERVRALSLKIYDALSPGAEREDDADRLMLEWSARLAEIGLSIAHAAYHKHSAYVLSNADMPGFSRMEQARLARIVIAHRGKLGKVQDAGLRSGRLEPGIRAAPGVAHPAQPHRRAASLPARRRRRRRLRPRPASVLARRQSAVGRRARSRSAPLEGGRHEARGQRPVGQESFRAKASPVRPRRAPRPGPSRRARGC